MDVSLFDFDMPEDRIALRPACPRDSARVLVVHPDGSLTHAQVRDLPDYLRAGDLLVANDSKVIAARLRARRGAGGPAVELLLHKRVASDRFLALARPAHKLSAGDELSISGDITARVVARREAGEVEIAFDRAAAALDGAIAQFGEVPLPPYIARRRAPDARDTSDYQTVFAAHEGSAAAPTAGLHFTSDLLARLAVAGVAREQITLHVGPGTFLPVNAADISQHRMHGEWVRLAADTAETINAARASGGRIVAVGTTSLRALETAADADGRLHAFEGETDLFVTPGYDFKAVDVLLTNFHLPRSTLFMLVCAFAGIGTMKRAYAEAIAEGYRFYSYGDACLLFRQA
ncbi:MAG TPA: tRNA preQ1(34) S-adenosylmethionine ribosyltransferase-isomerase QueA [Rhizomicrobium sp.]|jgi:S-adenosylmethionine:tRNA ribosyltransferase-isomerase|nr:tRNA preQ1(34) S-adenosylmethionine ribosyltransferase-isomerase QueA [Rhizomicrobium sp.]